MICYVKPNLFWGYGFYAGPANIWTEYKGFIPQSFTPSSYGLNFPTTGAHNLYFDLEIGGNNQDLSWAPVSHGGITATMTRGVNDVNDSEFYKVLVTLTGPVATPSQWQSENPGRIDRLSLPQVFELVGRDSHGNAVVKYGFVLKQWFVNRGDYTSTPSSLSSWCNKIGGYRVPNVRDLTNASCRARNSEVACNGLVEATPTSPDEYPRRHIGAGLIAEWGNVVGHRYVYPEANFHYYAYRANDKTNSNQYSFTVILDRGNMGAYSTREMENSKGNGVCVYP